MCSVPRAAPHAGQAGGVRAVRPMSGDWVALSLPFPVHITTIPLRLANASPRLEPTGIHLIVGGVQLKAAQLMPHAGGSAEIQLQLLGGDAELFAHLRHGLTAL